MTDKPPDDEPHEKNDEFYEDKFTWHEGDVKFIENPKEIEKILKEFLKKPKVEERKRDINDPCNCKKETQISKMEIT